MTPRAWQKECFEWFLTRISQNETTFVFEACMGAGKTTVAAMMAKTLLDDYGLDHVLVLVPAKSIQGDIEKGMLGTFGQMGLDTRDHFFTLSRRQPRQPRPEMDATVTLYQEVCCEEALETLRMWKQDGFRFALICDEIHHTNEINSSWGAYVEQLQTLASFSIFMSGTYFRSDKKPISCIPLDDLGLPVKNYRYRYTDGVKDNVVRAVTTRDINARILVYDRAADEKYEVELNAITPKQLSEAKKQVLDPNGECIRHMIETVHKALMQARSKFPDAACLFVCRPGGSDDYTAQGSESVEDKHVFVIAKQIEQLTGETPVIVTHRDRDAIGKIARFRRGTDPYLVAVNMVSEGCDIPRLRAVAFARYTTSEMLFRQIVGRALRLHTPEDGTAAQIYIPAFPVLVEFAERLYSEAQEGIRDRRCPVCGEWPCICVCPRCGQKPCVCEKPWPPPPPPEPQFLALQATPVLDGGHLGAAHIPELFVAIATKITEENAGHYHSNHTQLGHALLQCVRALEEQGHQRAAAPLETTPGAEREKLRRQINRNIRRLAFKAYAEDFARAYNEEILKPFHEQFAVILNTWSVDRLRQVADRLEQRIVEVFRYV